MSTNYGRGNGPEDDDRTAPPSDNENPTEPIADSHPTEPIRGAHPTEPIRGTHPTEPIRAEGKTAPVGTETESRTTSRATAAGAKEAAAPGERDNLTATSHGTSAVSAGSWDYTTDNRTNPAEAKRRPRVGTVVWGLIVIALAVVLLLAEVATLSLNMGQVIIGLLIGAGLALVIGGVISASNREKDDKHP